MEIKVLGAGLAGCEAAYQIAKKGIKVKLYEMKKALEAGADEFAHSHLGLRHLGLCLGGGALVPAGGLHQDGGGEGVSLSPHPLQRQAAEADIAAESHIQGEHMNSLANLTKKQYLCRVFRFSSTYTNGSS